MKYALVVNEKKHLVDVDADMPLLWVLRDTLQFTGTKFGCGVGLCGACTVHVEGKAVRACLTPIASVVNKAVTTIEGLNTPIGLKLINAWQEIDVPQCGYCQPGQIMSAAALLTQQKNPSASEIDQFMSGNLCRCGTYNRIRSAIAKAKN